ncbi:MAG: hypothetical protein HY785_28610 [Oscillatoriophycideae cyanobacterium NC_groundwater_1537_Pr4_S-0.65um_50_18]|nr:hypothetical protein [Oscillatoriophycideae cyanobacterium NC_groundwater_1537_Pr4_S-0.65um_50_18]
MLLETAPEPVHPIVTVLGIILDIALDITSDIYRQVFCYIYRHLHPGIPTENQIREQMGSRSSTVVKLDNSSALKATLLILEVKFILEALRCAPVKMHFIAGLSHALKASLIAKQLMVAINLR